MAAKKVRLPSAKITNEAGSEDTTEFFTTTEIIDADQNTSALSDVFETDQGVY